MISKETGKNYLNFLDDYIDLCRKYGCIIAALGYQKEVVTGIDEAVDTGLSIEQSIEVMEIAFDRLYDGVEIRMSQEDE